MEWDGVVTAIDGSIDRKTETMGAGFVVGVGLQPDNIRVIPWQWTGRSRQHFDLKKQLLGSS